jgi:hypothetical protein
MAKARIGEVFELRTNNGYGYFQLTHMHTSPPKMGGLIRVLGEFDSHQNSPELLAKCETQFKTFFPIDQAIKKNLIKSIGVAEIPEQDQTFPIFRNGVRDPKTKQIDTWWLWDGDKEWRVGSLTEEQFNFPIREVINDTFLIERISSNWTSKEYR